tara:strand:- start:217 stop:1392 length:1176 start_codon:yes stop_codon:yes gene_type:complete
MNIEALSMDERSSAYEKLMKNFNTIFTYSNRNAGGPQWFKYIVDMNLTKHDFELFNSFYCGVSGSPVDPKRTEVFDYVIVKDLDGNHIYGKYYRCCWPCLCDIMNYARVDQYDIEFNDSRVTYDVLTIEDPCCNGSKIPDSVSSYKCKDGKTQNGVYSNNGRLIFALFYDTRIATDSDRNSISSVKNQCKGRTDTKPADLQGGMGDIFVNLSLACKGNRERFSVGIQNHDILNNIYDKPLQSCKTGTSPGSWDSDGYCSETSGGLHQICFNVTDNRSDFSLETGQTDWSKQRVGNNHCMCLGAWALYKAKRKGDGNELVCNSIPDYALSPRYIDNWNTWNGNEINDQIIDGVDSLVQQCYVKQKDPKLKQNLKDKYNNLRNNYNQEWNSII